MWHPLESKGELSDGMPTRKAIGGGDNIRVNRCQVIRLSTYQSRPCSTLYAILSDENGITLPCLRRREASIASQKCLDTCHEWWYSDCAFSALTPPTTQKPPAYAGGFCVSLLQKSPEICLHFYLTNCYTYAMITA